MDSQIIAAAIAVVGTLGGGMVTAWAQRDAKNMATLEKRIQRYRNEIRARQAQEDIAAEWLHEIGAASSARVDKTLLRDRTEERRGLRPDIGPSEVRDR
jgi:hypothetical protein